MNQDSNPKPESVKLSAIRLDVAAQVREKLDEGAVEEYSAAMLEGAVFPPVAIIREGNVNWLADGRHRVEAAKRAHLLAISATVHPGTRADAELHAMGANADNGIRRSPEDKRLAVRLALQDPARRQLSDREVARICKVSQPFVGKIRTLAQGENVITLATLALPGEGEVITWEASDGRTESCTWRDLPGAVAMTGASEGWTAFICPAAVAGFFHVVVLDQNWHRDIEDGETIETWGTQKPVPAAWIPGILGGTGFKRQGATWAQRQVKDGPDTDEGLDLLHRWTWPHAIYRTRADWKDNRLKDAGALA